MVDALRSVALAPYTPRIAPKAPDETTDQVAKLREAEAGVQQEIQRLKAAAGSANVTVQIRTTRGPDGKAYATGVTVTTSQKVREDGASATSLTASLKDLGAPQIAMSSTEFAKMQAEENRTDLKSLAITKLRMQDSGVRTHEGQHFRAGGGLVSGNPEFETTIGPDGQVYAVGGHVDISTTPTTDPEKAARDQATFAAAASAPGDASAQDMTVARKAYGNAAERTGGKYSAAAKPQIDVAA